jgi:hypothetical protein
MAVEAPYEASLSIEALAIAERLAREGKLTAVQRNWPQLLREVLAKLPPERPRRRHRP